MPPRLPRSTAVVVDAAGEGSHGQRLRQRAHRAWGGLRRLGAPGVVLLAFIAMAAFPGLLSTQPLDPCLLSNSLLAPSATHPFGTDLQGCDYMAKTMHGARTSIVIGLGVVAASAVVATLLGGLAGWYDGWIDTTISRFADIMFSIPALLGALFFLSLFDDRSITLVMFVLTLFSWPPMVRLVRGAVRERRTYEHVEAAQVLGAGPGYLLRRHVLPHSLRPMLVFAGPYAATIVSAEAILSFVGAGLQLPANSWGLMLADLEGRFGNRLVDDPHLYIPGILLSLLVWSLVRIGSRLRGLE